jgi:hypothetical protein
MVFTLNLKPAPLQNPNLDGGVPGKISWDLPKLGSFDVNSQQAYKEYFNISPGMLIKFFNGIELEVPLKEVILRVDRLNISKCGYNIMITGLVPEASPKNASIIVLRECMLIYEINMEDLTDM